MVRSAPEDACRSESMVTGSCPTSSASWVSTGSGARIVLTTGCRGEVTPLICITTGTRNLSMNSP
ncbi:MAG: hypothetical protein OEV52_01365, partial [Dehalococcoidia bacterium]|nr:hypothetical protein [Dehalococcoidia bacterium]